MISQSRLARRAATIKNKADELYDDIRVHCPDPAIFDEALELCAMATRVMDMLYASKRSA